MPHTHSHTSITYLSWLFSGIKRSILSHHFVCCFCFLIVRDHIFIHRLGTALHCRSNPKQRARLSIFSLQHESLCAFLQFFFVFHSCSAADQSSAILKIVSELIPNTHANVYSFYIIISCVPRIVSYERPHCRRLSKLWCRKAIDGGTNDRQFASTSLPNCMSVCRIRLLENTWMWCINFVCASGAVTLLRRQNEKNKTDELAHTNTWFSALEVFHAVGHVFLFFFVFSLRFASGRFLPENRRLGIA